MHIAIERGPTDFKHLFRSVGLGLGMVVVVTGLGSRNVVGRVNRKVGDGMRRCASSLLSSLGIGKF